MDIVADALIRIKNAYLSQKSEALLPYSKQVLAVAKVLKNEGFIDSSKEIENEKKIKSISVSLKYLPEEKSSKKRPAITQVRRISKPGLRVYKGSKELPRVLNGLGIAIISTPKGVMTDKEARKMNLGGEVMAYVW